jgi:hypothetical protein
MGQVQYPVFYDFFEFFVINAEVDDVIEPGFRWSLR